MKISETNRVALDLSVNGSSMDDVIKALRLALLRIKKGSVKHTRLMIGDCIAEMNIDIYNESNYRFENINGKECLIIKSSL